MNSEHQPPWSLREIELAVEAEGREWTRQHLQQELQKEADLHGGVFPPQRRAHGASASTPDAGKNRSRSH